MYPGCVFYFARFVQVERDSGCEYVPGVICHYDGSPWFRARRLHIGHVPVRIRSKMCLEYHLGIVQFKMHGRVVHQSGLMQVYIDAVICLHLQGSLDSGR